VSHQFDREALLRYEGRTTEGVLVFLTGFAVLLTGWFVIVANAAHDLQDNEGAPSLPAIAVLAGLVVVVTAGVLGGAVGLNSGIRKWQEPAKKDADASLDDLSRRTGVTFDHHTFLTVWANQDPAASGLFWVDVERRPLEGVLNGVDIEFRAQFDADRVTFRPCELGAPI
jgi:hypothetical protein